MKLIRIPRNSTSSFMAKTFLCVATTLFLLLSARSSVFAGFTDATSSAGLNGTGYTFGDPIWGDFDGDGDLDLFVDNHYNKASYLYQNNGAGVFAEVHALFGSKAGGDRHGSGWCDFNNDGDLDLFITHGARKGSTLGDKSDQFYKYEGGQFTNIAQAAGVTNSFGRGRSVAWGDYNNDGLPDLLLGNLKTDMVLYKNNGDGTFTDVAAQAGLGPFQYTECAFADYNNDGFQDIFCTAHWDNHSPKDKLLKNNGDGTFTNVSSQAGILPLADGRAIAWGDYDNDGDLDLFISRGTGEGSLKQTLYQNNGDGTFTEVTDQAGLGSLSNNRAAAWGDFNNDGYLDLYVVNSGSDPVGKGANYLYKNNQDGTFTDVAGSQGVDVLVASRGRGAAWGDYDNDGFLDLFVTNGEDNTQFIEGPQILFHNKGNGNNWLKIKLVGTTSNRQGLGAKVTIQIGQTIQYREANGAGGHFLSQGAGPLHFGLGQATVVDQITVKWPSGVNQVLSNVSANQEITVQESAQASTDLRVTVTDGRTAANAGITNTYTIVVTNAGPSAVAGAVVSDSFPAEFSGVTFTATESGGATGFTGSGSGNINDTVTMPAASTVTYNATGTISSSATGTLSDTATVTAPSGVTDTNLANNSATDTDSIKFQARFKITVTDGKTATVAGTKNTYTIVLTNDGPSDVTGAAVTDSFPDTFTGVTYTATQSGGATGFPATGIGNINDTVAMPSGSKITYKATGTISSSATGTLSDTATVTLPTGVVDPNTANNSATDTDTLQ